MKRTEEKLQSSFASFATSLGYSEVHGRIIAALLIENGHLSLDELSKKTGYSASAISLSLDLLEMLGVIKKIKKKGDKKRYVRLEGDLLEGLRKAFLFKIKKEIFSAKADFEAHRKDKSAAKTVAIMMKEIKRLDKYVDDLSKVELPK